MQNKYAVYEEALAEELIPAMGCTEPIAIAYCAAVCREHYCRLLPGKCEYRKYPVLRKREY